MDIEKYLILIRNEDKTEQIDFIEKSNGQWHVRFHNNQKVYTYNDNNVRVYSDPNKIDENEHIVYENNQPLSGTRMILDFGIYVSIIFKNGYKKTYPSSTITIERSAISNKKANHCFDYLKNLANEVGPKLEGDSSFLSKQYNDLVKISPRSVLSAYLEGKPLNTETKELDVLFPFGFNTSQKLATEKAMTEQLSVIEGPPGTGKTQTILNIIANAILHNKTVAVVSNNNSATSNVLEKLQKYDLDFLAAYLGNKENKEHFFDQQNERYPDMSHWAIEESEFQSIKLKIKDSQQHLNKMLKFKNKQAILKQQLSEHETEYSYFDSYYTHSKFKQIKLKSMFRLNSDRVLQILIDYIHSIDNGNLKFRKKLYNFFVYGIYNFGIYNYPTDDVTSFLQKTYYDLKLKELKEEIETLDRDLNKYNFDSAMKEYSENSMKLFKASLAKRYGQRGNREFFTKDVLWKNFNPFIMDYPVILSTTHSLRNCAPKNYMFDYVIVDEASQVDVVTGALALSCAKNAVIVGDVKQLPNVVTSEVKEKTKRIFESYKLDSAYSYAEQSLLSSVVHLYSDIPKTLLKEHYRCHPKIIGFCNQKFYNNELVILSDDQEIKKPLLLYKTPKGNHARGTINQRQIDVIFKEVIPNHKINPGQESVGIISPYRKQANKIQMISGSQEIEADTVHKYQGREKDVIILSTVSNHVRINDFVDDPNLINVAISRAVKKLIVIVDEESENWKGTNIGDLVRYIKYNNLDIIESQIHSVFDLLYSGYTEKLLRVIKNSKQVSKHKSEILMNHVIEKVLSQVEFRHLNFVLHQPLRMLIKDVSKLTEEEQKYAMNILTHTDFVIFSKMDKMPVLVVEVDGHAFHENNPIQLKRDAMKDRILQKYGIPILRMKTTGSQEDIEFRNKLMEVLKVESS